MFIMWPFLVLNALFVLYTALCKCWNANQLQMRLAIVESLLKQKECHYRFESHFGVPNLGIVFCANILPPANLRINQLLLA